MNDVTVHKLDAAGAEVWSYKGRALDRSSGRITLKARFDRGPVRMAGLELEPGSTFIETFYEDRPYNVFEVHSAQGAAFRGWYCNLARPARIEAEDVFQEDLALDLIVLPGLSFAVLDFDEFAALDLRQQERHVVLSTLDDLIARATKGNPPFSREALA